MSGESVVSKLALIPDPERSGGGAGCDSRNAEILESSDRTFIFVDEYPAAVFICKSSCVLEILGYGVGQNVVKIRFEPSQYHGGAITVVVGL